ncbi:hypothetical protein DUI87_13642 [Hirundo rustica rustica]|uniref:ribonuclease H n=1 Tax=Hirundo rustica rustica TaxID=333673 RepID=A0A3M0K9S7_HIRRU|nr:hypothetical protein DUI87_13642 [Hirundo rustica rustica]
MEPGQASDPLRSEGGVGESSRPNSMLPVQVTKERGTASTQTVTQEKGTRNKATVSVSTQAVTEEKETKGAISISTQTVTETEQPKPVAVAPVQKKKLKSKSVRIVTDEDVAGPSHPAEETEPEIITHSLSLGELRDLRREFTCQTNESILTWLLCIWDAAANDTILDGSEARQLGSLSWDVVIDQGIGRTQQTLSLWRRLLTSVRDRYLCKEDLQVHQGKWSTMEQDDPSAVGLLRVEEQQVPIATTTVHRRQYRTDRDSVIPIHEMIRKLESQGVVSKARSPFNSPIWPVYILELQYELESKAAKWYVTTDLANAFVSISLAAECRAQFAFTWKGVQYTWNRLPQGWKHSPTICHGLIQTALEKGETPEHLQYIDDIIVWGNTAGEVFEKGEKIIQILQKAGFAIKRSKVKGLAQEIQFLGIKWQDGRCQIPTEVINKITAMSPPTNKKETQAFLGAIGFWRMHIPEYSQVLSPLYLVTRKKNDFHWGPEQQQAFAQIKQEITHAVALGPVRTGPDVKNVLYLAIGNNGLSWSLWQKVPGETRGLPLGFWSRSYRGSKANYTPTEKEILAAYEGVQAASEASWQRRGKPIWAAEIWQDIAARVEKLIVKVRLVNTHVSKSRANEEHHNKEQVDKAAKVKVSQVDLDWQHKGEVFLARWAHDASGHQARDATYRWARDRGVDLTMDNISQVIHNCETCAAIKQAKRVKPLWYGGRWLKYRYGEAWQIDYITLPQTRQGKRYVLTMVEATTGWLETYPVPHATAWNSILGLEKQVLWRHGTPERIE